jgi:hypothetical protein
VNGLPSKFVVQYVVLQDLVRLDRRKVGLRRSSWTDYWVPDTYIQPARNSRPRDESMDHPLPKTPRSLESMIAELTPRGIRVQVACDVPIRPSWHVRQIVFLSASRRHVVLNVTPTDSRADNIGESA